MKKAEDILKELGYVSSQFNTAAFMKMLEGYFLTHRPNSKLTVMSAYFGDFTGEVRRLGFVQDVNDEYKEQQKTVQWRFIHDSDGRKDYLERTIREYGENATAVCDILYTLLDEKLADIAVDCQYVRNIMYFVASQGYIVKKRKRKGRDYWDITLLLV